MLPISSKPLWAFCIAFLFCCSSCNSQVTEGQPFIQNIDAKTFKALTDSGKGIILDVRTPGEVAQGTISNASTLNIYDKDFVEKINLMRKGSEVYVYCKSGGRSSQAAKLLQENGFKKVYNLEGGIMAWEKNGYPLTAATATVDAGIQQMDLAAFKTVLNTSKPVLIDFHTTWCAPCRKMEPIVTRLEAAYKNKAVVMRIDIDKSKELATTYQVEGVPVFIIFRNGKETWRHSGMLTEEELKKQLDQ